MKNHNYIYVIFFFLPLVLLSQQGRDNIWLLGAGWVQPNVIGCSKIDFKNGAVDISYIPNTLQFNYVASTIPIGKEVYFFTLMGL